jgi:diguanylate cyclase (GGDEF)-like protein
MPDSAYIMMYLSRTVFLIENIVFLYVFLTPRRSPVYQAAAFIGTWIAAYLVRKLLFMFIPDPLIVSYIIGTMYLVPCALIFKETIQAKIFVFFMVYSLSQFTYLVFSHIDRFIDPSLPHTYVLAGMMIEVALLPPAYRHARKPLRSILTIIDMQNPVFTLFPILSFLLLAIYSLQDTYELISFITLVLSTTLIFFSYYLAATSISGTRKLHELERISVTDSLTGLYNRRYMEKKVRQELQQAVRTGSGFAIASADIDFFKDVNDAYGHDGGDCILKSIADVMLGSVRAYDTVARWGGEEFLLLFPLANEEQAMELSERIRKKVETERFTIGDEAASVTLTIGVSVFTPDDTVDGLIKKADIAMYRGKRRSRNCVVLYRRKENKLIAI